MHSIVSAPIVARLVFLLSVLSSAACSSKGGAGGDNAGSGSATAGAGSATAGAGSDAQAGALGSSAGSSGGGSVAGAAGRGTQGGAGASSGPTSCLALSPSADVEPLYTLPSGATTWQFAGSDQGGSAALIAVPLNRLVRLVALTSSGSSSELLNETEYNKNWSFDPTEVQALRTNSGVAVLVTDNAQATILQKDGSTVTVVGLQQTSNLDLHLLGFAPLSSGPLALYYQGDDTKAANETLTVLDITSMQKTTRVFSGPVNLSLVSSEAGAWLAAERLDLAKDCQDSGQVQTCSGGAPSVPVYSCTWHLDLWSVSSASVLQGAPLTTLDVPASISQRCDDMTPAGLATFSSTLGTGAGFAAHHAMAIDPVSNALAVVLQRASMPGAPGVQFEMVNASGARAVTGVTAAVSATNASSWLAVRASRIFMCGDHRCAVGDASGGTSFTLDASLDLLGASGVMLLPDGIGLLGGTSPSLQTLSCTH